MMMTMMMMVLRIVTASKLRRIDQESFKDKDKDSEESQQSSRIFRTVRT